MVVYVFGKTVFKYGDHLDSIRDSPRLSVIRIAFNIWRGAYLPHQIRKHESSGAANAT